MVDKRGEETCDKVVKWEEKAYLVSVLTPIKLDVLEWYIFHFPIILYLKRVNPVWFNSCLEPIHRAFSK